MQELGEVWLARRWRMAPYLCRSLGTFSCNSLLPSPKLFRSIFTRWRPCMTHWCHMTFHRKLTTKLLSARACSHIQSILHYLGLRAISTWLWEGTGLSLTLRQDANQHQGAVSRGFLKQILFLISVIQWWCGAGHGKTVESCSLCSEWFSWSKSGAIIFMWINSWWNSTQCQHYPGKPLPPSTHQAQMTWTSACLSWIPKPSTSISELSSGL